MATANITTITINPPVSSVAHTALQETSDLGGGLVASITINRVEPIPYPPTGDDWPVELDYIRVKALVQFPESDNYHSARRIAPELHTAPTTEPEVVEYFAAPALSEAVQKALAWCGGVIKPVREHHQRRLDRIRRREAALARALET